MSEGSDSDTERVLHDREAVRPSQLTTNTASPAVGPPSSLLLRGGDPATARACETAARCSTIINMLLDANDDHQSSADSPTRAHIAPAAAVASTVTSLNGTVAALTAKLELTRAKYQAAKTQLRYTGRATWLTASHITTNRAIQAENSAQSASHTTTHANHSTCLRSLTAILTALHDVFQTHGIVTGAGQVDEVC